jgi:hypothetical protein
MFTPEVEEPVSRKKKLVISCRVPETQVFPSHHPWSSINMNATEVQWQSRNLSAVQKTAGSFYSFFFSSCRSSEWNLNTFTVNSTNDLENKGEKSSTSKPHTNIVSSVDSSWGMWPEMRGSRFSCRVLRFAILNSSSFEGFNVDFLNEKRWCLNRKDLDSKRFFFFLITRKPYRLGFNPCARLHCWWARWFTSPPPNHSPVRFIMFMARERSTNSHILRIS